VNANLIEAVIFDMDGVLVDSEPLQYEAYRRVFADHGAVVERDEFIRLWVGRGSVLHEHIERHGLRVSVEEVRRSKKTVYDELVREKLKLRPGLLGLLRRLHRQLLTALASSAHPDSVSVVLEKFKLTEYFDAILTGGDVEHNKPHPEIYLKAAERLGVAPEQCLALEDSTAGVTSAKAAGMRVIALPHEYTRGQDFSRADLLITDLRNLRLRLGQRRNDRPTAEPE
jgi:HAD superfamily hydrolase (TIGR01509 family)